MVITPDPIQPTQRVGPDLREADPRRTGVVFVHGIGTQRSTETFLDWSAPIVDLLADWRAEHGFAADPVVRSDFSLSGTSLPYLELAVPGHADRDPSSWVITEAWWAAEVRPQRLSGVIGYVRRALPRILAGLRDSYAAREQAWDARLAVEHAAAEAAASQSADGTAEEAAIVSRATAPGASWGWVEALDSFQRRMSILAFVPALAIGSIVLLAYAALQLVPVERVRRFAILRQADTFMADWFGDLPSLLDDRVQSANIRARLAAAIDRLTANDCDRIVVIAHSGGAIVTFMTLLDPAFADRRVDKVVTLGQGLSVAWRLLDAGSGLPTGHRLAGDLVAARPNLRWVDYWATYDPATAGPLAPPPGVRMDIDSRSITNRMNVVEDHQTYWSNDEGFLIALLRQLDTPDRPADEARFFRSGGARISRIEWRRQRVGVLAAWRWLVSLSAVAVVVLGTARELAEDPGAGGITRLARDIGTWFATLPGADIITGPVGVLTAAGWWPRGLVEWSISAIVIAFAFALFFKLGGRAWGRWDEAERTLARRRVLRRPDRRVVPLVALGFVAALASLVVAVLSFLAT